MTREELAQEIKSYIAYIHKVEGADDFNVIMTETILGTFATYLMGREKGTL